MDTDALAQRIKSRFDHNQSKRVLREKYRAKMIFTYNGGMWKASPELALHCNLCIANGHFEPVLQDVHENPVKVDAAELKELVMQRWQEQMNAWYVEQDDLFSRQEQSKEFEAKQE